MQTEKGQRFLDKASSSIYDPCDLESVVKYRQISKQRTVNPYMASPSSQCELIIVLNLPALG